MPDWIKYQVAVGRTSLTSNDWNSVCIADDPRVPHEQAIDDMIRTPAPLPSPRFSGLLLLIEELLAKLRREKTHALVEFPCLNVLAVANHSDLASVEAGADSDLARLVELLGSPVARNQLRVAKQAPFDRLNLKVGDASIRLAAIYNYSVVMHPSPEKSSEDAMEIRFFAPRDKRFRYERFLDFGQGELDAYIQRAVKLGDAERLSVQRLSREDPNIFWLSVYRYKRTFEALARASGDPEWNEGLRDAVHTISYAAGAALDGEESSGPKLDSFKFSKLQSQLTEENRETLARSGFLQAMPHCRSVAKVGPGDAMTMEVGEGMRGTPLGNLIQAYAGTGDDGPSMEEAEKAISEIFPDAAASPSNQEESSQQNLFTSPSLVGQHRLCSGCGKKEMAEGIFKRCGRCRVDHVRYCGRVCQRTSWPLHKRVCTTDPAARPDPLAVRAVIFPGDSDVKPYEVWVPGPTRARRTGQLEAAIDLHEHQTNYIGKELLGCGNMSELRLHKAARGDPELCRNVRVYSRGRRDAPANMRASGVVTPVSESALVASGDDNPNVKIRGDAVLFRTGPFDESCPESSSDNVINLGELIDFPLAAYKELYGIFLELRMPGHSAVILLPEDTSQEFLNELVGSLSMGRQSR